MDIDICGPSIPRMMGLQGAGVHKVRTISSMPPLPNPNLPSAEWCGGSWVTGVVVPASVSSIDNAGLGALLRGGKPGSHECGILAGECRGRGCLARPEEKWCYFFLLHCAVSSLVIVSLAPSACLPPSGLIKNFLKDVYWGDLDVLVVDTPPGDALCRCSCVLVCVMAI
mgnify:FL=1